MLVTSEEAFLEWCTGYGIGLETHYDQPRNLVYLDQCAGTRDFELPDGPSDRLRALDRLLSGMAPWRKMWLWRRGADWTNWPNEEREDRIRSTIFLGLGIPHGTSLALQFDSEEGDKLLAVLFVQVLFGSTATDELFLVPQSAQLLVKLDKFQQLWVSGRDSECIANVLANLANNGAD